MKQNNFYKILILLLVVLNVVTISFFWFTKPPHPPMPPFPPGQKPPGIANELGLPEKTIAVINELENQHHKDKRALLDKDRDLHEALFGNLENKVARDSVLNLINTNTAEIEKMTAEFFSSVASHCNDEQKEELLHRIKDAYHKVRPPKPEHP